MEADRKRNENVTNDPRRDEKFPGAGTPPGQRPNPVTSDTDLDDEDQENLPERPGQGQTQRPNTGGMSQDPQPRKPGTGGDKR